MSAEAEAVQLTEFERVAIRSLKRLAKRWPRSLWLFATGGPLLVMRKDSTGRRAIGERGEVDQAFVVESIEGIESDGGDF